MINVVNRKSYNVNFNIFYLIKLMEVIMLTIPKQHARDYLSELKNKKGMPNWLVLLIDEAIRTNGNISQKNQDAIFYNLLSENDFNIKQEQMEMSNKKPKKITQSSNNNQELKLEKITHYQGVNALLPDQQITFSPTCTIIYGLNGTGKSGYFRVMNELAGGEQEKNILGNIYSNEDDDAEVDIQYLLDDQEKTLKWGAETERGIKPFSQIKVFDSKYLPIFLQPRENAVNIEPLGLNFFTAITSIMDDFKERLNRRKEIAEGKIPDLEPLINLIHSEDLQNFFEQTKLNKSDKKQLKNYQSFSGQEKRNFQDLKKQKNDLKKQNTGDRKKIVSQEKEEIKKLNDHLQSLKNDLEKFDKEISKAITDYLQKNKIRRKCIKEFEILKNIPAKNSEKWQDFIESAEGYKKQIEEGDFDTEEKCIYCHQPLQEDALRLVQAYGKYLNDQSQENFKKSKNKLNILGKNLEKITVKFSFSEDLWKTLLAITDEKGEENLKTMIDNFLDQADAYQEILQNCLDNKKDKEKISLDLSAIKKHLDVLLSEKQKNLNDLEQSEKTKKQQINKLTAQINQLEDRQNITAWQEKITNFFKFNRIVKKYEQTKNKISTRKISILGDKAHEELLTKELRQVFRQELHNLNKGDIEVNLKKVKSNKGKVKTSLKILDKDVDKILSEGEQKAIGLALFLAEINSQINNAPVVFDDPVNSLDHEAADALAKRLLQLSLDRQIIIFTHHKLFYESLLFWIGDLKDNQNRRSFHICKNYPNGCNTNGHHVYTYKMDREAKDKTGRVIKAQKECCKYYIKKAEGELRGDYSVSGVSGYLKSAIEHYIDENILNNQGLMKNRKNKEGIPWDKLKKLNPDTQKIDQLKTYWADLSNRGTHLTSNYSENPLRIVDFRNIITFLKQ